MSCKNQRFIKRSLTKSEERKVEKTLQADKDRWAYLFSLNKWTPRQ